MRIATVTTLKTSVSATRDFVGYHLRAGIDRLYLFFDDPSDEAIAAFRGIERVTCVRCDASHWRRLDVPSDASVEERQEANATYALHHARTEGIDWVAHIDSDELLHSRAKPLRSFFERAPRDTDVLMFPVMEAAPQQMEYAHPFSEITLFKHCPWVPVPNNMYSMRPIDRMRLWLRMQWWRRRKQLATLAGCTHSNIIRRYLLGHMDGKSAVRPSAPVARYPSHRPHPARSQTLQAEVVRGASLLHFDCQGFASWKTKWTRRVQQEVDFDVSRFSPRRRQQLEQIQKFVDSEAERGLIDLYKRWYVIPKWEQRIMHALGLIRHIRLTSSDFALPSTVPSHA
jgi:hypothetical protein